LVKPGGFSQETLGISEVRIKESSTVQEVVGVFGSKGDALQAIEGLYELGYGDTEIGFLDQGAIGNTLPRSGGERDHSDQLPTDVEVNQTRSGGAAKAIFDAGPEDEIGRLYREGVEAGSAVVTVSIVDGDEGEVSRVLHASGALNVNSYRDDTGWLR
jgi:hypothetical protein